jgi:2-keto-4-pentenoate hydratase
VPEVLEAMDALLPSIEVPNSRFEDFARAGEAQLIADDACAHRFAIGYHRTLRSRAATTSRLDSIPGLGPTRRKALLRHFGSVAGVSAASEAEIAAVPGVGERLAATVFAALAADRR